MKTHKKLIRQLNNYTILLAIAVSVLLASCNKNEENDIKQEPSTTPELPPPSTFAMGFTDFANVDTSFFKSTSSHHHWGWAAFNVGVWNTLLTVTFAIPVAAFYESFNHQGVWNPGSESWVWSYNFMASGVVHLAELHGSLIPEGVKWEMYISKNNAFTEYLWFYGISNMTNTEGEWHLFENPNNATEIIQIDWYRNPTNNTADIKYTNVKPGAPENGGYIFYGVNSSLPFDAFYNIYSANHDNLVDIEWNRTTKNGRISDENHFGVSDWRCWDENLWDVVCP